MLYHALVQGKTVKHRAADGSRIRTCIRMDACCSVFFLCLSARACLEASRICCLSFCCVLPPRATFGVELGKNMLAANAVIVDVELKEPKWHSVSVWTDLVSCEDSRAGC